MKIFGNTDVSYSSTQLSEITTRNPEEIATGEL